MSHNSWNSGERATPLPSTPPAACFTTSCIGSRNRISVERLNEYDPSLAAMIELRYFAGLTLEETAELSDISVATANRRQRIAEAWLNRAISGTAVAAKTSG